MECMHSTNIDRILIEAESHKFLEEFRKVSLQLRRVALGDQEQHSHGMEVGMGWFSMCQLNGSDTQRPNVSL